MSRIVLLVAMSVLNLRVCLAEHEQCNLCPPDSFCFSDSSTLCPQHSSSPAGSSNISDCVCYPGYYDINNVCHTCPSGFYCPGFPGIDTMVPCPDHSTSPEFSSLVEDCLCDPGYTGNSSIGCRGCHTGSYKDANGSAACTVCPHNTYNTQSARETVCDACPPNTVSYIGSDSPDHCVSAPGYFSNGSESVLPCPHGTYQDRRGQTACDYCGGERATEFYSTTMASTSNISCLPCPSYSLVLGSLSGAKKEDCVCMSGYSGPDGGSCVACPPGTYKDNALLYTLHSNLCLVCPFGTYSTLAAGTSSEVCLSCMDNSNSREGATTIEECQCNVGFFMAAEECLSCPAGKIQNGSDDSRCVACNVGTYEVDRAECIDCPEFSSSTSGATACTCNAGYQQSFSVCIPCSPGYFNPLIDGPCMKCPPGMWSGSLASITCTQCPEHSGSSESGMFSIDGCACDPGYAGSGGECTICTTGKYHLNSTLNCYDCLNDTYTAVDGSTFCYACGLHARSNVGSSQCVCDPGYSASLSECIACEPGYYKDWTGNNTCLQCPTGSYHNTSDILCTDCPVNTFQDSAASTECKPCHSHSTSGVGSSTISACQCLSGYAYSDGLCVECPYGHYKNVTSNEACVACAPGFSTAKVGSISSDLCQQCPHDSYVLDGVCVVCGDYAESPAGSVSVAMCQCSPGFHGNAFLGEPCVGCPGGYYKSTAGSMSCESCPPGHVGTSVLPRTGLSSCQACKFDTFQWNSTHCQTCTANSSAPTASASVHNCSCNIGHEGDAGTGLCYECGPGTFKNWSGAGSCMLCGQGTYSAALAASSPDTCVACPDYSTQLIPPPHSKVEYCVCHAGYGWDGVGCRLCDQGYYKFVGNYECVPCPSSSYYPSTVLSPFEFNLCLACPGNSSSPPGSYGLISCECFAGFNHVVLDFIGSLTDNVECIPCAPGSYCPDQNTVIACPEHKSSGMGSFTIDQCTCDPGYFGPAGAVDCRACPVNYYCSGGEALQPCMSNASTMSLSRQKNVTACQCRSGFFESRDGSCKVCPVDSYCNRDVIVACPPNSSATAKATSVDGCLCDGGFRRTGDACEVCPETQLCLGAGVAPQTCASGALVSDFKCVCQKGSFCTTPVDVGCMASSNCTDCLENHWCASNEIHTCPHGMQSAVNKGALTDCSCLDGTYNVNGMCVVCPFDSYCHGGRRYACSDFDPNLILEATGSVAREQCVCDYGFFRLDNTDKCKACPKNFYCPRESELALPNVVACNYAAHTLDERSYQSSQCICDAGFLLSESGNSMACTPCADGERCQHGFVVEFMCHVMQRTPNDEHTKCVCLPSYGEYEKTCHRCIAGSIKPDKGDHPCQFCAMNTYWVNTTSCESCPLHSSSDPGSVSCTCDSPFVMQDGTCTLCMEDEYYVDGVCVDCPDYSSSLSGATSVQDCVCDKGHSRKTSSNGTFCIPCRPGTYEHAGECKSCGLGASSLSGASDASACACNASFCQTAVWGWDCEGSCEVAPAPCESCKEGFYKAVVSPRGNNVPCHACEVAKYQPSTQASACVSCASTESHYLLAQKNVTSCQCLAGYEPTNNASAPCAQCAVGFHKYSWGDFSCIPCLVGTYADRPGALVCTACTSRTSPVQIIGANTTMHDKSTSVTNCTCAAGLFLHTLDNTSRCVKCLPGSFKSGSGTHGCSFCGSIQLYMGSNLEHHHGTTNGGATSSSHCTPCPKYSGQNPLHVGLGGAVLDDWTDCLCFGGYHNITRLQCSHCPPYMFKVGFSRAVCAFCAPGKYFVSNFQDCGVCDLRSADDARDVDVNLDFHTAIAINREDPSLEWGVDASDCACRLGFERIASYCHRCPLGHFRGSREARQCSVCASDSFSNTTGALACQTCPPFSTTLGRNGSSYVTDCICDAGFQWNQETLMCDACPAGTFRNQADVRRETLVCVTCPADHYAMAQALECIPCPVNERANAGSPSIDNCNCAPGYGNDGTAACAICPTATYSTGGREVDSRHPACVLCPANRNSSLGSVAVQSCLCVPGYGAGPGPCVPCADGFYSIGGHNDSCAACGWGAISEPPIAATSFDACLCNSHIGVYEAD